jgi:hypothetical protein
MSFKWRRKPEAEPAIETDVLPAELECLAEQLAADAARLAAKYPAAECRVTAADVRSPAASGGHAWRWAVAASLLAAAGITSWGAWNGFGTSPQPHTDRVATAPASGGSSATSSVRDDVADLPAVTPAVLFEDLSPAEQEAVLDVMEEEGHEPARLSI